MKVWVTKYALTKGIIECEARWNEHNPHLAIVRFGESYFDSFYPREEWHLSFEAACARAELMRQAKMVSLRKALQKMENLTFTRSVRIVENG